MTVRVLVEPTGDPATGLAVALRCTMDLYVRMPHDVVLAVPDKTTVGAGPLADLIGKDAAELVAQDPQPFAGHTLRLVDHHEVADAALEDKLVVVSDATAAMVDRIETQKIAGVIVLPHAVGELEEWAVRTHAELVRAAPGEPSGTL